MIIRVKFEKKADMRYIGHLDLMRTMQRALRRADLPIAYSQGYNPQQKMNFAMALALGMESEAEYMEVEMAEEILPSEFADRLNSALPAGIQILHAEKIEDAPKSLMSIVSWSLYAVCFPDEGKPADAEARIETLLGEREIWTIRRRKKKKQMVSKQVEIRQWIDTIKWLEETQELQMMLKTGSNGNLKPEEVLPVLFPEMTMPNIRRLEIYRDSKQGRKPLL
jgi:radical SAM-linked protein